MLETLLRRNVHEHVMGIRTELKQTVKYVDKEKIPSGSLLDFSVSLGSFSMRNMRTRLMSASFAYRNVW